MARRTYDDETRAAVLAALLVGQSVTKVAETYDIPEGTIWAWKARHAPDRAQALDNPDRIGELLVEYLEESLKAIRAQVVAFSDPEWLRDQRAESVGVLHGIMVDKAVRLLEAMSPRGS